MNIGLFSCDFETLNYLNNMKVIRERILNAVHKCLQWENGEIAGIDMLKLEQRVDGILEQLHKPDVMQRSELLLAFCEFLLKEDGIAPMDASDSVKKLKIF